VKAHKQHLKTKDPSDTIRISKHFANGQAMKFVIKTHHLIVFSVCVLVSTFAQIGSDLYLPSLPAMVLGFKTSTHNVQLTITIYIIGGIFSSFLSGPLSDALGRRNPILFGLVLCAVGGILCALTHNLTLFLLGRLLQGIGTGFGATIFRAILRDLYSGESLSRYGSYSALISITALACVPVLGGWVQTHFDWRMNFWLLLWLGIIVLILFFFLVEETNTHKNQGNLKSTIIMSNFQEVISRYLFL
jgi:DHA1 family 2-module integral membrane pump EmrD-like MFS transporter